MKRSWHCITAAALALLLTAAPASAITAADRAPDDTSSARTGWLNVLADWFHDLIGDQGNNALTVDRNRGRSSGGSSTDGPPPPPAGEPPEDAETDNGPGFDPNG